MGERVSDKIEEIEEFLQDLDEIMPHNYEEYLDNLEKRLACERLFEKITQATNDLAIIFIKHKKFENPTDDFNAFEILADKKIINFNLSVNLKDAFGMRNFIIHQYSKINNELVFEAIHEQLEKDAREFLQAIRNNLK